MDTEEIIKPRENLFLVERTSCFSGCPLKGCFKAKYLEADERTVNDPKKLGSNAAKTWYSEGINHRIENGHIMRDIIRQ